MKGKEIIERLVREEMPDAEAIRLACHKTPQPRRKPLTTAVAALLACFVFTTAAVAAGYYFGSFDRLREIIGPEQAEALTPIETLFSVDGFFHHGFRGELVAVGGRDAHVVDLFLTIEDMTGNRLADDFTVWANLKLMDNRNPVETASTPLTSIIDRTNCGIVTLHKRYVFQHSLQGEALNFTLNSIQYNHRRNDYIVDFDLGTLTEQTPAAYLWDTPILPPHQHNIPITPEAPGNWRSATMNISGMGLINGRLHIQKQYGTHALNLWVRDMVQLINPQGEYIPPLHSTENNTQTLSFYIDAQGNIVNTHTFGFNFAGFPYREHIFDVDVSHLSEYTLIIPFDVYDEARLNWQARFTIKMPHQQERILAGLDIYLAKHAATLREIRITPFIVYMEATTHNRPGSTWGSPTPRFQLRKTDGSLIEVLNGLSLIDTDIPDFSTIQFIGINAIDIYAINALLVNGEVILEF